MYLCGLSLVYKVLDDEDTVLSFLFQCNNPPTSQTYVS